MTPSTSEQNFNFGGPGQPNPEFSPQPSVTYDKELLELLGLSSSPFTPADNFDSAEDTTATDAGSTGSAQSQQEFQSRPFQDAPITQPDGLVQYSPWQFNASRQNPSLTLSGGQGENSNNGSYHTFFQPPNNIQGPFSMFPTAPSYMRPSSTPIIPNISSVRRGLFRRPCTSGASSQPMGSAPFTHHNPAVAARRAGIAQMDLRTRPNVVSPNATFSRPAPSFRMPDNSPATMPNIHHQTPNVQAHGGPLMRQPIASSSRGPFPPETHDHSRPFFPAPTPQHQHAHRLTMRNGISNEHSQQNHRPSDGIVDRQNHALHSRAAMTRVHSMRGSHSQLHPAPASSSSGTNKRKGGPGAELTVSSSSSPLPVVGAEAGASFTSTTDLASSATSFTSTPDTASSANSSTPDLASSANSFTSTPDTASSANSSTPDLASSGTSSSSSASSLQSAEEEEEDEVADLGHTIPARLRKPPRTRICHMNGCNTDLGDRKIQRAAYLSHLHDVHGFRNTAGSREYVNCRWREGAKECGTRLQLQNLVKHVCGKHLQSLGMFCPLIDLGCNGSQSRADNLSRHWCTCPYFANQPEEEQRELWAEYIKDKDFDWFLKNRKKSKRRRMA